MLPRPRYTEGFFKNRRAQQLFYSAFFPENSSVDGVEGVVLFMHGINEHSHRFTHVFERLVSHRFGVIAYDMISHGRSDCDYEDLRGHSENFHHMVDDTNDFLTAAKYSVYKEMLPPQQQTQEPPLFFMGISYGCLVGLHTVLSGVHPFQGMVMAAPALGVEPTLTLRIQNLFAAPIVWLFPHARIVPGVNFDGLSRNEAFVQDYMTDKLNITDNMTARMGVNTVAAMHELTTRPELTDPSSTFSKMPILLLQGTQDKVTSGPVARSFFERVANFDKKMIEYEGLYHCLFNEPEREQVFEDSMSWLIARARRANELVAAQQEAKTVFEVPAAKL